jgi:hypothetical protein
LVAFSEGIMMKMWAWWLAGLGTLVGGCDSTTRPERAHPTSPGAAF